MEPSGASYDSRRQQGRGQLLREKIALYIPTLLGGGAERVMVNLARGFVDTGLSVDLVLARAEGPYLSQIPKSVRVVNLSAGRVLASLPRLVTYLRQERPRGLISAQDHANVVAIWARELSRVPTRLIVSVHTTYGRGTFDSMSLRDLKRRLIFPLMRVSYAKADRVVAVSNGVARSLIRFVGLSERNLSVIYNPVVMPEIHVKALEHINHPWFRPGEPPVVLGVGRLAPEKDFATLIRAFAKVRKAVPARLMILGEGSERAQLTELISQLGLECEVELPGFVDNPYKYMRAAGCLVLSSKREGLPTVLIEALALGTPVVATDCPSGPAEILASREDLIVPVGDEEAMAAVITKVLQEPRTSLGVSVGPYELQNVIAQYCELISIRS